MMKKTLISVLLTLGFCFSMFVISSSVFAEEIETNVTVRIIRDDTIESESSKEKDNNGNLEKQKDTEKSKEKSRLPKANELINPSISIIGTLILLIGILGIYINNKRNGENKNEKN